MGARTFGSAAAAAFAASASAQFGWTIDQPVGIGETLPAAFDPVERRALVADSVGAAWSWNGVEWARLTAPGAGAGIGLYDPVRRRFARFGGGSAGPGIPFRSVVQEFDGTSFSTRVFESDGPGPCSSFGAAYDPELGGIVLFGGHYRWGSNNSEYYTLGSTWLWNGAWRRLDVGFPGSRSGPRMVYDPGARRLLMTGGSDGEGFIYDDVWELRASGVWTQLSTPRPRPTIGSLYYDPSLGVLTSFHFRSSPVLADTRLNLIDEQWRETPMEAPLTAFGQGSELFFHPGYGSFFALGRGGGTNAGAWVLRGARWERLDRPHPGPRFASGMAWDAVHDSAVVAGGYSFLTPETFETWTLERRGARGDAGVGTGEWVRHDVPGPSERANSGFCADAGRGVSVLFGGRTTATNAPLGDTWEWNGAAWTLRTTSGPPPRSRGAMVYDRRRGVSVLFGGLSDDGALGDTWEWNGSTWARRTGVAPPARYRHAMAHDEARGVVVLFGGVTDAQTLLGDTWEFDGSSWTLRSTTGPAPRIGCGMVFDAARTVTRLWGGWARQNATDAWEWNGTAWTSRPDLGDGQGLSNAATAYDPIAQRVISFGGCTLSNMTSVAGTYGETRVLSDRCPAPVIEEQPIPQAMGPGGEFELRVRASAPGRLAYQWRREGAPISGATDEVYRGVMAGAATAGLYDCLVWSIGRTCMSASATSDPAEVLFCPADFNSDGLIDAADIEGYVAAFEAGEPAAELNGDGFLDFFDYGEFLASFETGC